MKHLSVVCVLILVALVAGCGQQTILKETVEVTRVVKETVLLEKEVTRLVKETVLVEKEVSRIVEEKVIVEKLLPPTPTKPIAPEETLIVRKPLTPTPAPTTPVVEIPANWLTYKDMGGDFTLRHPPYWDVDDMRMGKVRLDMPDAASATFRFFKTPLPGAIGDEESLEAMVRDMTDFADFADEDIKKFETGVLTELISANYIRYVTYSPDWGIHSYNIDLRAPLDARHHVRVTCHRAGDPISNQEVEDIARIVASMVIE